MAHANNPPDICPVCGESVPPDAKACPGCGADERAGWDDDARVYDALDLPDESFDRSKFLEEEFGVQRPKSHREKFWLIATLVTLAAIVLVFLFR